MKAFVRSIACLVLLMALLSNALPCGPGYITPLFDTTSAPENPYSDYAAGRLGIVKPTFHRSVLYAAYRYIAGNGMSGPEQRAIIEVWNAEINNENLPDDPIDEVVKAWVNRRAEIVGKEETTPAIYVERSYGGYDFFPNCTKNAFETASETLSDRATAHGPNDKSVLEWVKGQDQVFQNCASGKQTPDDATPGSPEWLQKDRAYQKAAAEFYSLDYASAKRHFAEIALDSESPWAETADYLVARTLIRQASLSKTPEKAAPFYDEAEKHLERFISRSGRFAASAERLMGLVKYRRHPKERVSELAKKLSLYGSGDNFRQDVIDYTWLLDRFESELLTAEEKRKQEEEEKKRLRDPNLPPCPKTPVNAANIPCRPTNDATPVINTNANSVSAVTANTMIGKKNDGDLEINLYLNEKSYTFYVKPDAADDEAIAEAEKVIGHPLTEEIKTQVKSLRQSAYAGRFTADQQSGYDGSYWGDEKLTPTLLPDYLRKDDLTDWLYTYQMPGAEAYLYSLNKYRADGSALWLMTALSKADKSSTQLPRLLEAAGNVSPLSPAYATIAFHHARILLQLGRNGEAKKLLDEMLNMGDQLTISARNAVMALRLNMAETLEDFLKYSLEKPFAFDFDGDVGNIEEFIAEQKTWFDPETNKEGREAYDREIEERFAEERLWKERLMFDDDTIEVFNQHFPTVQLLKVADSPALPDYMRERFIIAIWTRAFLLDDMATLLRFTPQLVKYHPEFAERLAPLQSAKTLTAQDHAVLFFVLKNPILSPYVETGMGKDNNEQDEWSSDDWWCEPYDTEYSGEANAEVAKRLPPRPAFLTATQSQTAQAERKRLREIGDAPKFLSDKVMTWAKRSSGDRRVPEALYIMIEANGWTKYGCGSNEELRDEMAAYLMKNYPNSEWTRKLAEEETEK